MKKHAYGCGDCTLYRGTWTNVRLKVCRLTVVSYLDSSYAVVGSSFRQNFQLEHYKGVHNGMEVQAQEVQCHR